MYFISQDTYRVYCLIYLNKSGLLVNKSGDQDDDEDDDDNEWSASGVLITFEHITCALNVLYNIPNLSG